MMYESISLLYDKKKQLYLKSIYAELAKSLFTLIVQDNFFQVLFMHPPALSTLQPFLSILSEFLIAKVHYQKLSKESCTSLMMWWMWK